MDYSQTRRISKNRSMFEESEDEYSFSTPLTAKPTKIPLQNFSSLYDARSRFLKFVEEIGEHRSTQIRQDIVIHCEQNGKKQKIYEHFGTEEEGILKIINLRIQKYSFFQCRMIKNKRIKKNWSQEDVQILVWVVSKYSDYKNYEDIDKEITHQDWEMIATLIPGVTADSCMFKWLSLKKVNLATNNWSSEESLLLAELVKQKGNQGKNRENKDWKLISQKLYIANTREDKIFRNAKQCREHWNCYLNPNLKKGPWRQYEDIQLLRCIRQNKGSKKWSQIVRYFDGRTQNALKNRYTLIIDKQRKHNKHKNELQLIDDYLQKCYVDQFTTQIKEYGVADEIDHDSYQSFVKEEDKDHSQEIAQAAFKAIQQIQIMPVRIQKFDFQSFAMMDRSELARFIQPGVLNNGVFQKTSPVLRKAHSSFY